MDPRVIAPLVFFGLVALLRNDDQSVQSSAVMLLWVWNETSGVLVMFRSGHDRILQVKLDRVVSGALPATELPEILGYACIDRPNLSVVGYDASDILRMFAERPQVVGRYG